MTETELIQAILKEFGALPTLRLGRQNTGVGRDAGGRMIRFGTPGQADISGILGPHGRRIEIECKSMMGRQTKEQKAWEKMITALGGVYILARTVDDARRGLVDAGLTL